MRISDLGYAGVSAWPPAWTSSLPTGRFLAGKVDAVLRAARTRGAGVDIEISIDGVIFHGLLLWDGEPAQTEVVHALQAFIGRTLADTANAVIRSPQTRRFA